MDLDLEKMLAKAVNDGFTKSIEENLRYNNAMKKIMDDSIEKAKPHLKRMLDEAISSCVNDEAFVENIRAQTRQCLAKLLVQRFGGELERQVNALKSDPTTRARIVMAIDDIVKSTKTS